MKSITMIREELEALSKDVSAVLTALEKKAESFISDPPDELTDDIEKLEEMRDNVDMVVQEAPEWIDDNYPELYQS